MPSLNVYGRKKSQGYAMKFPNWARICPLIAGSLAALLFCLPLCCATESAARNDQTPKGITDVATVTTKREVDIGLMYNGDYIYFFGSVPNTSVDVIVKLTSVENAPLSVNQKGKVALMWMNVKQFTVTGLPLLYKIHSTRPISQILSKSLAHELGIGYDVLMDQMHLKRVRGTPSPEDARVVFDGVLKIKKEANLYNVDEKRIEISGGKLFKHYFRFPPAAKEGTYRAESYIIKDGKLIGKGVDEVVIQKKGIEAAFTKLAYKYPAVYGAIALIVALSMGLFVGFVFKKGGGH
jgi:uncharacterized protein (TIGR02186 family)